VSLSKHQAGTLETIDGRRALRFERTLPHGIDRVWRAVSEPREMEQWFVAAAGWKPETGESFEVMGQRLEVIEATPPRRLAWSWGEERYSFDLAPAGPEATTLVFLHFFDEAMGPGGQHAGGWEAYLSRLDVHLDGGHLTEMEAHEIVPELSEHYAIAFGEDAGPARASYAKHGPLPVALHERETAPMLRFERRYGYPVERLWRAISDPAERAHWFPSDVELVVVEEQPPTLLIGSFHDTEIRFELTPEDDGEGCTLVFTHRFDDLADAPKTAAGWDRCFARMQALLAGAELGEKQALELWPIVHERYAEQFGLSTEPGERALAEHPLT